ncbi:MAG TPA: response regulator transcription factor [Bryobacteraceae bacterium]
MPSANVLVVDDEASLRKALRASLSVSGFLVAEAGSGDEALEALHQRVFELVLLDINMPGLSGIDICRRIRGFSPHTGIVMVTVRDFEEDKVRALEAGADDYVTKPFRLRELIARLHAVLRRTRAFESAGPSVLTAGELEIDIPKRRLTRRGEEIHLSPTEFDLLVFLMKNVGAPLTHTKLLRSVWGPEYGGELEYLRSYIRMLRKKIERNPASPEYILTEPWVGYRFRNPSDPDSPPVPAEDEE